MSASPITHNQSRLSIKYGYTHSAIPHSMGTNFVLFFPYAKYAIPITPALIPMKSSFMLAQRRNDPVDHRTRQTKIIGWVAQFGKCSAIKMPVDFLVLAQQIEQ